MKKRILIIILVSVLVLAALVVAADALITNFFSEGVHVLGKYAHLDFKRTCYFIDTSITEADAPTAVTGETTTLTISGVVNNWHHFASTREANDFSGNMELAASPIPAEENMDCCHASISNGMIYVSNWVGSMLTDREISYDVHMLISDPDVCVIKISGIKEGRVLIAVCGDSEEDAIANYEKYLEKMFDR